MKRKQTKKSSSARRTTANRCRDAKGPDGLHPGPCFEIIHPPPFAVHRYKMHHDLYGQFLS